MSKDKSIGIEDGLIRLDEILGEMEEPDTDLSRSFMLYEEGIHLLKNVNEQIDAVEKKVMVLSAEGNLSEFDGEDMD